MGNHVLAADAAGAGGKARPAGAALLVAAQGNGFGDAEGHFV
jgi:hypothetical protein